MGRLVFELEQKAKMEIFELEQRAKFEQFKIDSHLNSIKRQEEILKKKKLKKDRKLKLNEIFNKRV